MRTLILASLSLAALAPASDACGVPDPTVFELSSHYTRGGTRTFVLTGEAPTTDLVWRQLAPGTYDGTQIAAGPSLARPIDVTLVGPSGTRVVSARARSFLRQTWIHEGPVAALEVEANKGEYAIAVAGKHADATWHGAAQIYASNADVAWVKAQGMTVEFANLAVDDIGGELQTVTASTNGKTKTFVRSHGELLLAVEGHAAGVLVVDGDRFLVSSASDNTVRANQF